MDKQSVQQFQNFIRLQLLLATCGCEALRKIFRFRYDVITNSTWIDGSGESKSFGLKWAGNMCGTTSIKEVQKQVLKTGDVEQWDLILLGTVLLSVDFSESIPEKIREDFEEDNEDVGKLLSIKTQLSTLVRQRIPEANFIFLWNATQQILEHLDASAELMTEILLTFNFAEFDYTRFSDPDDSDSENISKAKSLAEEAGQDLNLDKIEESIKKLTSALELHGLPVIERTDLLCKRSSGYIKLHEVTMTPTFEGHKCGDLALADASLCIELRPSWWLGYYRAAQSNLLKGDRKSAFYLFNNALCLNPSDIEEIKKARDLCQKVEDYDELPQAPMATLGVAMTSLSSTNDLGDP